MPSRGWERSGGRDKSGCVYSAELDLRGCQSKNEANRGRLEESLTRRPAPPQVGHGESSFSAEPCSARESWQGLCKPALLSNSFGSLAEFWAGSQVTHWVPVQPVRASVSSSVQRQDLTTIPRPFSASTSHSQTLLSGEQGRAREKGGSAVSTKDKGSRAAERTRGHLPASPADERVWGLWAWAVCGQGCLRGRIVGGGVAPGMR